MQPTPFANSDHPQGADSASSGGEFALDGQTPRAVARLLAAAHRARRATFRLIRREPAWFACWLLLVIVWGAELFLVQELSLTNPNKVGPRFAFWAAKIRFVLDFLFVGALATLLPRRLLAMILFPSMIIYLGLLTYNDHYRRSLSLLTVLSSWREGWHMSGVYVEVASPRYMAALAAILAVKLILLSGLRPDRVSRKARWSFSALLAAAYLSLYGATLYLDPLKYLPSTGSVGRQGVIRGYVGPWLAEWYYFGDEQILNAAVARRAIVMDRLTPIEAPIPVADRLVIVQMETLEHGILGHRIRGEEVTPFLNSLRDKAMYYRVQAAHYVGTCDADFTVLAGVLPSLNVNTYSIPAYPYDNALPEFLARYGFKTYAFHGNHDSFYHRRSAFLQMGFARPDGLYFRHDLLERFPVTLDNLGVPDAEVFRCSAELLKQQQGPTCHFVITLTTHTPYNFLKPSERELFPNPQDRAEHFFNSMRYLDRRLRDYIESLPGHTTVFLYSDQNTEVTTDDFHPDRKGSVEYGACFIYDTQENLAKRQKTRHFAVARDGTLHLLDVVTYLRGQVARTKELQAAPTESTEQASP